MSFVDRLLLRLRPVVLASACKRILRRKRRSVHTALGTFYIDCASYFGDRILTEGIYEPEMVKTLRGLLNPGETFVDLGAHEGYFSVVASKLVGPSGRVVSVEPQSRLQQVLKRNLAVNDTSNVTVVQTLVSNTRESGRLQLAPDMNSGASRKTGRFRWYNRSETVHQVTLAQLFEVHQLENVRLLKIDVEGAEAKVLMGSSILLTKGNIEHIALELHPSILRAQGESEDELLAFLSLHGYRRNLNYTNLVLSR